MRRDINAIAGIVERKSEQFFAKVNKASGCWIWTGSIDKQGYGSFPIRINGKCHNWRAHRISYWFAYRTLPPIIDHVCNTPACVRPDHLVEATDRENILRGSSPSAINARKQYCKRGHHLTPDNLTPGKTWRHCLQCKRSGVWRNKRPRQKKEYFAKHSPEVKP